MEDVLETILGNRALSREWMTAMQDYGKGWSDGFVGWAHVRGAHWRTIDEARARDGAGAALISSLRVLISTPRKAEADRGLVTGVGAKTRCD